MKKASTRTRKPINISEERLKGKVSECEFFLERMKGSSHVDEFGYFLSAFLSAFKSCVYLGLTRAGKNFAQELQRLRDKSHDVDCLLEARDVEVHREGIHIWLFTDSGHRTANPRFRGSLWGDLLLATRNRVGSRYGSRFRSRFQPKFGDLRAALELTLPVTAAASTLSFIFQDSGQEVIKTCSCALEAIRSLVS